jgi:hypothetical protein
MTVHILIDGNHRAKKALILGKDFSVYVLTPEESWKTMEKSTSPTLLKMYINPTTKPAKAKPRKPTSEKPKINKKQVRADDLRARSEFLRSNSFEAYIDRFEFPLWMDDESKEMTYLQTELDKLGKKKSSLECDGCGRSDVPVKSLRDPKGVNTISVCEACEPTARGLFRVAAK